MEGLIILSAIFSMILIIVFFKMSINLEKIRKSLDTTKPIYWLEDYQKQSYFKRDKEALHSLQEFIWASLRDKRSKGNYELLKNQYKQTFINLGSDFPRYPYED